MLDDEQLRWVVRNRRHPERAQLIGLAARIVVDRTWRAEVQPEDKIRRVVLTMGDDEFRAHCVLGRVKRGELTIVIDDVRRLYAYRLRWERALAERIKVECPGSGVRTVRFVHSCGNNTLRKSDGDCWSGHEKRERAANLRTRN